MQLVKGQHHYSVQVSRRMGHFSRSSSQEEPSSILLDVGVLVSFNLLCLNLNRFDVVVP